MARDCSNLQTQLEEITRRKVELFRRDGDLFTATNNAEDKVDSLVREYTNSVDQLRPWLRELDWWKSYITTIESKAVERANDIANFAAQIAVCEREIRQFAREQSKTTSEGTKTWFARKIKDRQASIAEFRAAIPEANERKTSAEMILAFHRPQLQQFSIEVHALSARVDQVRADVDEARREVQICQDRTRKARAELGKLVDESNAKAEELAECEKPALPWPPSVSRSAADIDMLDQPETLPA